MDLFRYASHILQRDRHDLLSGVPQIVHGQSPGRGPAPAPGARSACPCPPFPLAGPPPLPPLPPAAALGICTALGSVAAAATCHARGCRWPEWCAAVRRAAAAMRKSARAFPRSRRWRRCQAGSACLCAVLRHRKPPGSGWSRRWRCAPGTRGHCGSGDATPALAGQKAALREMGWAREGRRGTETDRQGERRPRVKPQSTCLPQATPALARANTGSHLRNLRALEPKWLRH